MDHLGENAFNIIPFQFDLLINSTCDTFDINLLVSAHKEANLIPRY